MILYGITRNKVLFFLFINNIQQFIIFAELPPAPVVSPQPKPYDDTSLIERLDTLQKQYEELKKQMVSWLITLISQHCLSHCWIRRRPMDGGGE
jgi:hypothetical protein